MNPAGIPLAWRNSTFEDPYWRCRYWASRREYEKQIEELRRERVNHGVTHITVVVEADRADAIRGLKKRFFMVLFVAMMIVFSHLLGAILKS